eukprot:10450695-Lingulodinium_polyedra.AAC.1
MDEIVELIDKVPEAKAAAAAAKGAPTEAKHEEQPAPKAVDTPPSTPVKPRKKLITAGRVPRKPPTAKD